MCLARYLKKRHQFVIIFSSSLSIFFVFLSSSLSLSPSFSRALSSSFFEINQFSRLLIIIIIFFSSRSIIEIGSLSPSTQCIRLVNQILLETHDRSPSFVASLPPSFSPFPSISLPIFHRNREEKRKEKKTYIEFV